MLGQRVLLVDTDLQATATAGLLGGPRHAGASPGPHNRRVILGDAPLADVFIPAGEELEDGRKMPFALAASHIELAETDSRRGPGFDTALREALAPVRVEYDWIILDAPPNLGMLTWMGLAAAVEDIIPVRTEPPRHHGVWLIIGTITKIQRRLNPSCASPASSAPSTTAANRSIARCWPSSPPPSVATLPCCAQFPDNTVFSPSGQGAGRRQFEPEVAIRLTPNPHPALAQPMRRGDIWTMHRCVG